MITLTVVGLYLLAILVIGFFTSRKRSGSTKETFVAGGSLGLVSVIPLLFGELIAGASTTGTATNGFTGGLSGLYAMWGLALGCIFVAIFLAPFFAFAGKRGAMSGPEAFGLRFNKKTRMATLVVAFIALLVLYSMQPKAIASLLSPIVGLSIETLTWIVGFVFLLMALTGIRGIAGMNFLNAIVLFVGMLIVVIASLDNVGGLSGLTENLPESYFDFWAGDPLSAIASIVGAALGFGLSAAPINTCFCSKTPKVACIAFFCGALFALVFALFPCLVGMAGAVATPEAVPASILYTYPNTISPVLSTIAVLVVAAAVFSSGPFFLLYLSTLFTRDIAGALLKIDDDRKQLAYSRVFLVVIVILASLLANHTGSIISQILGASQIQAAAALVLIIGLHWKRVTDTAAFWSIVGGCGVAVVWHFAGNPFGIQAFWLGLSIAMVILVVMSLANGQAVSDDFKRWERIRNSEPESELSGSSSSMGEA